MTSRLGGSVLCNGVRRLRAVARVLAVVTLGGWFGAPSAAASVGGAPVTGPAQIGPAQIGPAQIGPAQINVLGDPGLCWQAGGNGSPITLERCDPAIQGQQWSLTGNGVMMNGNGYCLEAGTGVPVGVPLYIDFAGQCGGSHGQVWQYRGGTGQLSSTGICAGVGGPISPGAEIVQRACPVWAGREPGRASRWSIGYSAVTVAAGTGSGPAGGQFGASVTVANAASAQTAYGVAVMFALPPYLAAADLHVAGGGPGWSCDVRTLTCTGTLMSGASGRIGIAGRLPAGARPGDSYTVVAQASVAGTSQRPGTTRTTASVTVAVHPAAPGTAGAAGQPSRFPSAAGLPLVAVGVLLLGGGLLIVIARRTRATPAKR